VKTYPQVKVMGLGAEAAMPSGEGTNGPKKVNFSKVWPQCFLKIQFGITGLP
jgi:hypothetical protein